MSNLSKNIRKYRESRHLSQEELAKKLYVTRQTISNYENGKSEPDLDRIKDMADFFGVEMQEMIQGQNQYVFPTVKFVKLVLLSGIMIIWIILASKSVEQMKVYYSIPWFFLTLCPFAASVLLSGIGYLLSEVLIESRILKRISLPTLIHKILSVVITIICISMIIVLFLYIFYEVQYTDTVVSSNEAYLFWNQVRAEIMLLFSFHPLLYGIFPILDFACSYSKR